ncbi:MAG: S-adenosyl-l-methionine hydroxide adenosyltransferase family protein [Acidobacteriota bacterium]
MKRPRPPIVTLLTDFGSLDPYVAEMKGVLLAGCPDVTIVDITHEVPPFDIRAASHLLERAVPSGPAGTVHVGVVDPGVGSDRDGLLVRTGFGDLVGPDNGLFDPFLDAGQARVLDVERLSAGSAAPTFHGRDLFAPAAARLARGDDPASFTGAAARPARLPPAGPEPRILHIDRFGNCITSLRPADLGEGPVTVEAGGHRIGLVARTFAQAPEGQPVLVAGSSGRIEIVIREASAADILGLTCSTRIRLLHEEPS